jgi:hypothetical protein
MRLHSIIPTILIAGLGINPAAEAKENPEKPAFQAVRIEKPINLSGKLDDPSWQKSLPVQLTFETRPGENTPASQQTFVYAVYDKEYLYLGFDCRDTAPGSLRSHLSDRDRIFNDDYVIVTIDTYNDYQKGYEFAVNPQGVQSDLLMMSGDEDLSYDMVWQSAAAVNDNGWTAEMAIPFKVFNFNPDRSRNGPS